MPAMEVSNYEFVNDRNRPVSFSDLPQLDQPPTSLRVYLRGVVDGVKKISERVVAWKLDVSQASNPKSFVLLKNGTRIKLLDPKINYQRLIRSILITIHMLHFLKFNFFSEEKTLWDHLKRFFGNFEGEPCEDDLIPHLSFIKEFSEQDENLRKSLFIKCLLERNSTSPTKEEENDVFDNVCCICDNGGELLCCEGKCMRSFHATKKAGEESNCESLGFSDSQLDAITNFICKNCELKQHQCFICGKLGNSDKTKGAEVFQCANTTCGYFYHPKCISKKLSNDETRALKFEKIISENGKFTCPYHKCSVCKGREEKDDFALQFAVCRRCPKTYHRKCLPREIEFEDEGVITRAWEDLLPNNRILIYCMKHKIDKDLGTPLRNHIQLTNLPQNKDKNKEKEKNKEKGKENENESFSSSSSKRNRDPDYSPSLEISNKIRTSDKQKIQICQTKSKSKERENKKQERENKKEKSENTNEERENKTEKSENQKEERENNKEERENKRKFCCEERETESLNHQAKKRCTSTGVKDTVQIQVTSNNNNVVMEEPMGMRHVSVMDLYAPRLEETNLCRPGPEFNLGFGTFSPIYYYDMNGVIRRDLPPYQGPPPGSCGWISD